jgi:hypothetical protein
MQNRNQRTPPTLLQEKHYRYPVPPDLSANGREKPKCQKAGRPLLRVSRASHSLYLRYYIPKEGEGILPKYRALLRHISVLSCSVTAILHLPSTYSNNSQ